MKRDPEATQKQEANPFIGPKPIPPGEPFHGRSREIRELLDQLVPERIVLLYSPSGAGKTSLIQAGLLPALGRQGFVDLPIVRLDQESPAELGSLNRYVASLLLSLEEGFPYEPLPLETLMALDIGTYLDLRQEELGAGVSLLLILDQFEEIVTLDPTDIASKKEFFRQLGQALDHPRRWALFSMREDHVASLDPYLRLLPTRLRTRYRLDLLSPRGAHAAVQEPAAQAGCQISDAAAQALVDDLRRLQVEAGDGRLVETLGPSVEPVHLQVVCRRWWLKEGWKIKNLDEWQPETGGDVDSALRSYYEESLRKACSTGACSERTLRRWVEQHLISPDGVRTKVLATEAAKVVPPAAQQYLIQNHLVRHERLRGISWFELAHDRLVGPIHTANQQWFENNQSPLERHATLWDRESRRDELLLRGRALSEALEALDDPSSSEQSELTLELVMRSQEVQRTRRWKLAFIWALLCFLPFLLFQNRQIQTALSEERAKALALSSLRKIEESPGLATLLAMESSRFTTTLERLGVLLNVFDRFPRLETQLRGPAGNYLALSFAQDGWTLRGATSETIESWSLPGWRSTSTLANPVEKSWRVAFDAAGDHAAFLAGEGWVEILGLSSGHKLARFELPEDFEAHCLIFSPTGDKLLLGGSLRAENWLDSQRAEALLWSLDQGALEMRWHDLSKSKAMSLALDTQGSRLAIGFSNGTIQIRSLETGRLLAEDKQQHNAPINALHFLRKGSLLVSASEDWTVRAWNLLDDTSWLLMSHEAGVMALAVDHSGRYLVSGSLDTTAGLWDLEENRQIALLRGHRGPVLAVAIDHRGQRVATSSRDGRVSVWRVETPYPSLGGARTEDSDVAFDSSGERLSVLDRRGRLANWMLNGQKPSPGWERLLDPRRQYSFFHDTSAEGSALIASTDRRHKNDVRIDRLASDASSLVLSHPSQVGMNSFARAPTTDTIFTTTTDGSLFRWDPNSGVLLESYERAHGVTICALVASPVEALLVSSDVDGSLRLWQFAPFEELPVHGQENTISKGISLCRLAIDPTGKVLATADHTGALSFWDLDRHGLKLRTHIAGARSDRYDNVISSLAFDHKGELLALGGYKEIQLWDVAKHRQIGPPLRAHQNRVTDLAFSPTAPLLASSSADRVVLWDLDVAHWRQRACRLANRNLSRSEWRQYVGENEPYRVQCPEHPVPED